MFWMSYSFFGRFPSIWILCINVSEHSVCSTCSIFTTTYEDGTDGRERVCRNVSTQNSGARKSPRIKYTTINYFFITKKVFQFNRFSLTLVGDRVTGQFGCHIWIQQCQNYKNHPKFNREQFFFCQPVLFFTNMCFRWSLSDFVE